MVQYIRFLSPGDDLCKYIVKGLLFQKFLHTCGSGNGFFIHGWYTGLTRVAVFHFSEVKLDILAGIAFY